MLPKSIALLGTVGLLASQGFFLLGTLPLLILKHDTPTDSWFIRGVFNTCYLVVIGIASLVAVCFAVVNQWLFCAGVAAFALTVFAIRLGILAKMDRVRDRLAEHNPVAAKQFRRIHIAGMLLNASLLATVTWTMTRLGL